MLRGCLEATQSRSCGLVQKPLLEQAQLALIVLRWLEQVGAQAGHGTVEAMAFARQVEPPRDQLGIGALPAHAMAEAAVVQLAAPTLPD